MTDPQTARSLSDHQGTVSAISSGSMLPQLRGLLEVSRLVRDERDLTRLCDRIAATISASLGFRTVAINLYRPAEGDFQVVTVHGNEEARAALLGSTRPTDAWAPFLHESFFRRGAYLIPHDEADWDGVPSHVPDIPLGESPDAWHPEDALVVPMWAGDGTLLGVVSVDEPESGVRPADDELDVLVAFAEHVASALESAQEAAGAARDRAALGRLLEISASLVDLESAEAVLATVARGIADALEFEKVAVCIADAAGGFVPSGTAGWADGDPALDFALTTADLETLLVPEFEVEGCYLIEYDVANALVRNGSSYRSQRGGAGPQAWRRHWLLVPLVERNGSISGFIWVDDPADAMLPSRAKLQALRTFANQATVALHTALDFEVLNARNAELAALHETTVALLDRIEVDSVLRTMLESARWLVRTDHGYLYVVDGEQDRLRLEVGLGYFEDYEGRELVRGEGLSGRVWEQRRTIVVDDYESWDGAAGGFRGHALHASIGVPLLVGDEVAGVLGLVLLEPGRRFEPSQVALLERFARLASLALENARVHADLQRQLTERSILDEQLRQAHKMEAIGRLAGGIAHDFNNLLTAILGYAELTLLDVDEGSALWENVVQIERAASRAADLTGQLLAYSRKQVLRPQVLDLNAVVAGMVPMLARMLGDDVLFSTALEPELGTIRADPAQIEQVVLNLAVNARDAMPDGGRLVIRTVSLELDEGPHAALVVADTGAGMEETVAAHIFEPFFTTKPVGEGTGLGLATVHGIVAQSGGTISVTSEPGVGTTFTVCFPLAT